MKDGENRTISMMRKKRLRNLSSISSYAWTSSACNWCLDAWWRNSNYIDDETKKMFQHHQLASSVKKQCDETQTTSIMRQKKEEEKKKKRIQLSFQLAWTSTACIYSTIYTLSRLEQIRHGWFRPLGGRFCKSCP